MGRRPAPLSVAGGGIKAHCAGRRGQAREGVPPRATMNPISSAHTVPMISDLLDLHAELDEDLALHREALMRLDLTAAREHLSDYTLALTAHIREEEEVLLPAYEELNVEVRGGGAHLYRAEHQKIHWWLGELDRLMTKLEGRSTVGPREVLAVLDRECTFSHLMGNHDLRERGFLYPILDASLTVEARAHLWAGIRACRMEGNS